MTVTTKATVELSYLSGNQEINQRALDLATAIVIRYSDPALRETCCSAQDLLSDIAKQFMRLMLELNNQEKHHEAWLQCAALQAKAETSKWRIFR